MRTRFSIVLVFALVFTVVPLAPVAAATDTWVIDADTTLTADHTGPIAIHTDGLTLDCAFNKVLSSGEWTGISLIDVSRVTVKNCIIEGFVDGVGVFGGSRLALLNNTVVNSEGAAFWLWDVTRSTIRGNTARMEGGLTGFAGFAFNASSGNAVHGNSASGFTRIGFDLTDSFDNTLKNNRAVGVDTEYAIGFFVRGPNNVLIENTVSGCFDGISVNAAGNVIARNVVAGIDTGGSVGIAVVGSDATGNTVMSNTASGTGFAGFFVVNASDNILSDNVAFDNPEGFQLWTNDEPGITTGNRISRNQSYNNGIGFVLQTDANGNTLFGNVAHSNDVGFAALGASGNTFTENVSTENGFGFYMGGDTAGNTLDRNSADMNQTGFWDGSVGSATAGSANLYKRNTCAQNTLASDPAGLCVG